VTDQATAQAGANPVHAFIADAIKEHDVVLFMKGTPDAPRCGFSSLAVQILDHIGASFVGVDVLQDEALREGIKTFSDWPTIPQLYVKGEFVGGSDIVREMFNAGELQALMAEKGVALGEVDA
jgi:monothiol glutaredoxin